MGNIFDTHHVYESYHYNPHRHNLGSVERENVWHDQNLVYRQWQNSEILNAINQQSLELSSLAVRKAIRDWEEYSNYKDKCVAARQAKLDKLLNKENKLKKKFIYWCCYSS